MGFVKCYDVAEMVIDEATEQFGFMLKQDRERLRELKECCDIIDTIAERFGGVSYEVEVDDETTDITVSLVCGEFEVDMMTDDFNGLTCKAKKLSFKPCGEEQIQIDFVFCGIWVKVS